MNHAQGPQDDPQVPPWLAEEPVRRPGQRWAVPVSIALHLLLLALLLLWHNTRAIEQAPQRSIEVEILTEQQFIDATRPPEVPTPEPPKPQETLPAPPTLVEPETVVPQAPPEPDPQASAGGVVRATEFFAAKILSDPANAEVRDNLPLLASDEQLIQVCNMEALEQIHAWRPELEPDTLVPYAFDDMRLDNGVLQADGAAFRNQRNWFHFRFSCTVAADLRSVSAFEFVVGDAIPPEQWEEHYLNAEDDPLD